MSEKILSQILDELKTLKEDTNTLKDDMHEMKLEQTTATQRLCSIENKTDIIQKQTAANAEQLSTVNDNVQEMLNNNRSIHEIIGEHEISIRTMRRKSM